MSNPRDWGVVERWIESSAECARKPSWQEGTREGLGGCDGGPGLLWKVWWQGTEAGHSRAQQGTVGCGVATGPVSWPGREWLARSGGKACAPGVSCAPCAAVRQAERTSVALSSSKCGGTRGSITTCASVWRGPLFGTAGTWGKAINIPVGCEGLLHPPTPGIRFCGPCDGALVRDSLGDCSGQAGPAAAGWSVCLSVRAPVFQKGSQGSVRPF